MSEIAHIFGTFLILAAVFAVALVLVLFGSFIWMLWKDSRALTAFEKQLLREAKLPRLPTQQIKAGEWRGGREE